MRNIPYASVEGCLMYVMLCTRLDIYFIVGLVSVNISRYQAVKHILKYLQRTRDYMLVHSGRDLTIIKYIDFDFQMCQDLRKSTSSYVFVLRDESIFLIDLEAITLYCDNSVTIANTKETRNQKRKKHIDRKYHIIMEVVADKIMDVVKVTSKDNLMDPFMKTLLDKSFEKHVESIIIWNMTYLLH
ncbi:gag/pol protein [Gossypium australe]|uniref:Gag/pol protein n=1 Tax=Gossypium australe TaxID=47621 RepID=A0A5B6UWF6_9ROSI|nr:gag/pol protein [Gossypium australe]